MMPLFQASCFKDSKNHGIPDEMEWISKETSSSYKRNELGVRCRKKNDSSENFLQVTEKTHFII